MRDSVNATDYYNLISGRDIEGSGGTDNVDLVFFQGLNHLASTAWASKSGSFIALNVAQLAKAHTGTADQLNAGVFLAEP